MTTPQILCHARLPRLPRRARALSPAARVATATGTTARPRVVMPSAAPGQHLRVWSSATRTAPPSASRSAARARRHPRIRVTDVVPAAPRTRRGSRRATGSCHRRHEPPRLARGRRGLRDGEPANRPLLRALARVRPGDEVQLQLLRGRETRTVRVKTVAPADLARESTSGSSRARARAGQRTCATAPAPARSGARRSGSRSGAPAACATRSGCS
jgi:hypothetical protein